MAVKIRLMRIGAKKRPFYRVVAVDERKKRTGGYLELLGTYNPLTEPKEVLLKQDRIDEWLKKGAQPSDGFLRIIGKAPQKPPRKPKKEKKKTPTEAPTALAEPEKQEGGIEQVKEGGEDIVASADQSLSEPGEISSKSTSTDVHEPDRAGSDDSRKASLTGENDNIEPAETENQDTSSERSGDVVGALRPDEQGEPEVKQDQTEGNKPKK